MKQKKIYCLWKNLCEKDTEYLCCAFCKKANCKFRCYDSIKVCKYLKNFEEVPQLQEKSWQKIKNKSINNQKGV